MPLLAARQEVAKKTDFGKPKSQVCLFAKCEQANIASQDVPSWNSLSVPRYKVEQEKDIKFYYTSLSILPPRAADMGSKMCCFLGRGGACSSRLIGVFLHGGRIWDAPLHSWSVMGRGDGVNLQSKLMPSETRRGPMSSR